MIKRYEKENEDNFLSIMSCRFAKPDGMLVFSREKDDSCSGGVLCGLCKDEVNEGCSG
jgi:hypothetical protein